ncbi:hypothetical protein EB1_20660 [Empedobacter brevis NBRC 14943 = ATCC 43319]|uniref:Uncharacterized protein n=1 Tax=Empedobacter brevis NBRC 14943 = ATCC 43319 TaxID=1218108 RepID=A0A511NHX2_9FLAO|nr:hypothetical protein EB1_20660 [Empedobacter brevis NBRC 14943 = ATCC 43319]
MDLSIPTIKYIVVTIILRNNENITTLLSFRILVTPIIIKKMNNGNLIPRNEFGNTNNRNALTKNIIPNSEICLF